MTDMPPRNCLHNVWYEYHHEEVPVTAYAERMSQLSAEGWLLADPGDIPEWERTREVHIKGEGMEQRQFVIVLGVRPRCSCNTSPTPPTTKARRKRRSAQGSDS